MLEGPWTVETNAPGLLALENGQPALPTGRRRRSRSRGVTVLPYGDDPIELPDKPGRRGRLLEQEKRPVAKSKARPKSSGSGLPTVPAVPEPTTAIVGRGRGRPRKNPVDSTGNQEIKGKNNARTKKIKDKEYIATTAPVMGYYDVTNDAHMMKPKKIPAHIINAI